ncbi:MAG: AsmA family protein [Nitrospinota bacterium]
MWRARRKRSAGRRILKALGVLALLCIGFLLILPYLVNLERYRGRIAQELSHRLGRPVHVSSLRVRVIPRLSVEIHGLQIRDPKEFGGKAALTAGTLRANVRVRPLLQRRLEIGSVHLDRTVLVLRRDKAGFNNLFGPKSLPPAPSGGPPSPVPSPGTKAPSPPEAPTEPAPLLTGFLIGNLNIEDAEFHIEDPRAGAPIVLRGIDLTMRQPSPDSAVEVHLRAKEPGLQADAQIGPVDFGNLWASPIEADVSIGDGWFPILQRWLNRGLSASPLRLTGASPSGEIRIRGNLAGQAEIKGDLSVRKIQGRVGARSLSEDPNLNLHLKSSLKLTRTQPEAPPAIQADGELSFGNLLFHLTGRGTLDPKNLRFQAEAQGAQIQGSDLLPLLKAILGNEADALKLAGLIGFNVALRGEGPRTSMTLALEGQNMGVQYGAAFRKPAGTPLKLEATLVSSPGKVEVKPFSVELRQISFRGELRQSDGVLGLKGETNTFNLEGLDTLFPLAGQLGLAGKTRIEILANGTLEEVLGRRTQIRVTIEDGAASLPGWPTRVRNLHGLVLVTPQSAQISRTRAEIGKSRMELEARLTDFRAPRVRFDVRASSFRLEDFLPRQQPSARKSARLPQSKVIRKVSWRPGGPSGPVFAESKQPPENPREFPAILKRTEADGTLRVQKGEARGVHFQNLTADLRLREGRLRAERMKAEVYGGTLEGSGEYALDRQPAPFQGSLSLKDVQAEKALTDQLPGPALVSGRADLEAEFKGVGVATEELKRALSGKGKISITDGELRNLGFLEALEELVKMRGIFGLENGKKRFDRLAGPFQIEKGKVMLPGLGMTSPGLSVVAKGDVGLDLQSRLKVTAVFDKEASRRLSRGLLGNLIQPGKPFEVPFRVQGALTAPKVSLHPGFLKKTLRREPAKFIRDTLERLLR